MMASDFTFIHAADVHLDSPLTGLAQKDENFSQLVRGATRRAFANVVDLAIEEGAAFVVIAGDLYDGAWKDQSTGQFAIAQLARLSRAGIRSVIAFGNHDAESRITRHLTAPEGVYKLTNNRCETVVFDDLGVAIHGRSYKEAATTENIAATYNPPTTGMFNVALLHTALEGHPSHAPYAPCSVGELQASGHDYWALGHVHDHSIQSSHPWIVYPGNTQGRHVRETGAKGAVVVRVQEGAVVQAQHRACDEVRWSSSTVDAVGARDVREVLEAIQDELRQTVRSANNRPIASRLTVSASGQVAQRLLADPAWFESEVRGQALGVSDALWIEKVRVASSADHMPDGLPPEIAELLAGALEDPDCARALEAAVAPLLAKLPSEVINAETSPLVAAARSGDSQALVAAARSAIEARLGLEEA